MNRRISFHEAAELEIIDAASFFVGDRPELSASLVDEVERAIEQILMYPQSCPLVNRTRPPQSPKTISLRHNVFS